jgi:D-alanine-D-alanine ligase
VIFGGRSTEHDVSCRSAVSVLRFLDRARYEVVPIRISREGEWLVGVDRPAAALDVAALEAMTPRNGLDRTSPADSLFAALDRLQSVDVAFPCLHGPYGEDGTVQGFLELAGVRYVGSGVLASATAMDKEFTKKIVSAEGIVVADGIVLRGTDGDLSSADRARLGLPVFVKPARSGSSVGVSRVDDWDQLAAAIAAARKCDGKVLVEAAVPGREIDLGLLQQPDGEVLVGPPLEINLGARSSFFDYCAKYRPGAAEFVIPADLNPESSTLLAYTARRVFDVLGCTGLLRADFFLAEVNGSIVPVLNEVNSMPGLTELSQFPRIWRAGGLAYPELLDRLISTALANARSSMPALR